MRKVGGQMSLDIKSSLYIRNEIIASIIPFTLANNPTHLCDVKKYGIPP